MLFRSVENGVVTANLKDGFTKSLGDAENTQVIDTTKFEFGRYYKFDIPATVKADVAGGVDIENTAAQVVNYYNPTTKKVEKPNVPTEKRVNSVPISVEFNFTKRLEGRELKANEFSYLFLSLFQSYRQLHLLDGYLVTCRNGSGSLLAEGAQEIGRASCRERV